MNIKDAEVRPVISRVAGASGDVENGDVTPDNLLTFFGTAGPGVALYILDDSYPVETVQTQSDGSWTLLLSGLTETKHIIKAANVGGQLESEVFEFTVGGSLTKLVENFEEEPRGPLTVGQPHTCRSGLILTATGDFGVYLGKSDADINPLKGRIDVTIHSPSGTQPKVIMRLPSAASRVDFDWAYQFASSTQAKVTYSDGSGGVVGVQTLPMPGGSFTVQKATFTAPSGPAIVSLEVDPPVPSSIHIGKMTWYL
ncbi:hypothetical protein [Pseudomonas quasicaspiana]|uniref:hypothetical protein n=1 Tax=Pseudomonas quasicaspiana TaxID=2829821 RepID=UPI000EFFC6D8|nr:hypothetical protein [Pseudomonas quasicaspiana]MCD5980964.1 hypothetical protein [Pseudomonas quasicaspiana]